MTTTPARHSGRHLLIALVTLAVIATIAWKWWDSEGQQRARFLSGLNNMPGISTRVVSDPSGGIQVRTDAGISERNLFKAMMKTWRDPKAASFTPINFQVGKATLSFDNPKYSSAADVRTHAQLGFALQRAMAPVVVFADSDVKIDGGDLSRTQTLAAVRQTLAAFPLPKGDWGVKTESNSMSLRGYGTAPSPAALGRALSCFPMLKEADWALTVTSRDAFLGGPDTDLISGAEQRRRVATARDCLSPIEDQNMSVILKLSHMSWRSSPGRSR